MRVWVKVFDDTHMIESETIEDYSEEHGKQSLVDAIIELCKGEDNAYLA